MQCDNTPRTATDQGGTILRQCTNDAELIVTFTSVGDVDLGELHLCRQCMSVAVLGWKVAYHVRTVEQADQHLQVAVDRKGRMWGPFLGDAGNTFMRRHGTQDGEMFHRGSLRLVNDARHAAECVAHNHI